MSEVLDLDHVENVKARCIQDVDFESVADPKISACVIAYEVVHWFGPETRHFPPHN